MMTAEAAETSDSKRRRLGSGRFQVIADIGEGGTAHVQLAMAAGPGGFNKLVVLKTLRENLANDKDIASMFRHEARLAARMNHPNIVQTYEVIEDAGRQVMVMEYLEGQPLSQIVGRTRDKTPLSRAFHLRILCNALAGIHYAHELGDFNGAKLGLVHRDVSPQNVFVTYEGQVKVLDFGIAKAVEGGTAHTELGVIKGKIRYMAPEQMVGAALDRRADIFAVGIMLWEALAGRRLWGKMSDVTVMTHVVNGEIPPLRSVVPDVPEELERICAKAMASSPRDRYETAQQFEFDLENAMVGLGDEVKQRDLGHFVAGLFTETRTEMQALIESSLGANGEPVSSQRTREDLPSEVSGPSATTTGARFLSQEPTKLDKKASGRGRPAVFVAALLAVAVVIGVLAAGRRHAPKPAAAAVASAPPVPPSAAPSAGVPPEAAGVQLRIVVSPAEAHLFLDGKELPSNPYVGSFPRDDAKHGLRVEASGYVTREMDVALTASSSLTLTLEHAKATPGSPHVGRHVPSTKGTAAAEAVNCAQPYFIDEQGIKRIRVECM